MSERWSAERPVVRIEVVADRSARDQQGFLRLRRFVLRNLYSDGVRSAEYRYDLVEREAMDAVAIVLYSPDNQICLRTALRPPLAFRSTYALPLVEPDQPVQWEIPAGLVEPDEHGEQGLRACAAREAQEEVGAHLEPDRFVPLGPAASLSPGVLAEKLYYLAAELDPSLLRPPGEDGTPVEERAWIAWVPIGEALAACDDGRIADLKTEVAIRRLARARGGA